MFELIKTPWKSHLLDLVSQSKKSIKITSPFIKENICSDLLSVKKENTYLELITSFKLKNIHSGSLDLRGLERLINANGVVKNLPKLHSKIYLFDDKKAIITSGNLTNGGLLNNYEYGVYTTNSELVSCVVNDFSLLSSNENIGRVKLSDIEVVRKILAKLPRSYNPSDDNETFSGENNDVLEIEEKFLTANLSGWKLEVFKCAQIIPEQIFTLNEINKFESELKNIFPSNQHIKDKIRQQLQYLRDLGLIEFLGNGRYRKLWK